MSSVLGRADELDAVFSFVDAKASGAAALVLYGQAGIGKTTIWREGVRYAREIGVRTLVAQPAETEVALPYAAIADLLDTVAESDLDRLPQQQRAAVEVAVARGESVAPLDQHALARGLIGLLADLLSAGGLLVAIDDVQWLDGPTAAALSFALRRLGSSPLRLFVSLRAEGTAPPQTPLGLERWDSPPRWVDVGPLAPTELGALLRSVVDRNLPRPQVELLARASGGNPMFALELARRDPADTGTLPSFAQTLTARIRDLEPAGQDAVTIASAALQPSLDLLVRAGVDARGIRAGVDAGIFVRHGDGLSFAHPLLASAAYEALLPGERHSAHERLVGISTRPIERAHHVSRAATGPSETAGEILEAGAR
jgi:AAA ATPase domain